MMPSRFEREHVPLCPLCASAGDVVYRELDDVLYGAPEMWELRGCTSATCGLVWLDPRPTRATLSLAYQSYYTHPSGTNTPVGRWSLRERVTDGRLQRVLGYRTGVGPRWHQALAPLAYLWPGSCDEFDITVAFLSAPRGPARVLDVGCGDGRLLLRLRRLGWTVFGQDPDPLAVAAARAQGLHVDTEDVLSGQYADASFDAVVMSHVIEHVYQPERYVGRARQLLRSGGQLVMVTPNVDSWGRHHFGRDWRGLEPPRHLHLFSQRTLSQLAERAGFVRPEVRTLSQGARTILSLSEAIQWARATGRPWAQLPNRKLKGILYQMRARAAILAGRGEGEELLLRARVP